ncbi:MAG: response regulator [Segetibacter sp.]|nr:response regulator [Segetibacter sp.]
MLVDDDEDDRLIFTSVISEIDATIDCICFSTALNSLKTLQTKDTGKPDCIFLDLNLPLMHGFEFLKIIKTSKDLHDIPVIIYSTSSREADKIKAKELGASNFLSKPSSMRDLKEKVTELLTTVCCNNN